MVNVRINVSAILKSSFRGLACLHKITEIFEYSFATTKILGYLIKIAKSFHLRLLRFKNLILRSLLVDWNFHEVKLLKFLVIPLNFLDI